MSGEDVTQISSSLKEKLNLDTPLVKLFKKDSVYSKQTDEILQNASDKTPDELKVLFNSHIEKTLEIFQSSSNSKLLIKTLDKESSLKFLQVLKTHIKNPKDDVQLQFSLELVDALINNFQYSFSDIESTVSLAISHIEFDIVSLTLIKFYALFKLQTSQFFEEQLEIQTLDDNFISSFKLLTLLFQLNSSFAKDLFNLESLQVLLNRVSSKSSTAIVKNALLLLSAACVDEDLRKQISEKYLNLLISAVKYSDDEIKTLSSLVIVKPWNFTSLDSSNTLGINDLVDVFLSSINEYSIEGLAYLSVKNSVKVTLREDEGFLFEFTKALEHDKSTNTYGILVTLANLSTIDEDDEFSDLKKHATKGLEDGDVEEDEDQIRAFHEEIIERKVISNVQLQTVSKSSFSQLIKIIYNLSTSKNLHSGIIKQGGLNLLLSFIGQEHEPTDFKKLAYKTLSSLLITSDPHLIFNKNSPKTALNYLFQHLSDDNLRQKEQFQSLLSLTNLAILDVGPLAEDQWGIIDGFLNSDNTVLRRSAIELVSNLMQHKSNLPALFNFENSKSKQRYTLLVSYIELDDVKSQISAIGAVSYAATIEFIAEELIKEGSLLVFLGRFIVDKHEEQPLVERALFVLYYLVCYHNDNTLLLKDLRSVKQLEKTIKDLTNTSKDSEVEEIAKEIAKLLYN